jgi:hypothetical protein
MKRQAYNFKPVVRGNTLDGRTFTVTFSPIAKTISSATMKIKDKSGTILHQPTLTVLDNVITMPDVSDTVTATWPAGTLSYDIDCVMSDGKVKSYIYGSIPVIQGN